jgi:hypothetical protein
LGDAGSWQLSGYTGHNDNVHQGIAIWSAYVVRKATTFWLRRFTIPT